MSHITVGRWGKNLAIRFPSEIASAAGIREGERVEIDTRGSEIVIRHLAPHFTLEELFAGRSPAEWRAEYAGSYDWGPDVGRENIDECDIQARPVPVCRRSSDGGQNATVSARIVLRTADV